MVKGNSVLMRKDMDMEKANIDTGMERVNMVATDIAIVMVMEKEKVMAVMEVMILTMNMIIP